MIIVGVVGVACVFAVGIAFLMGRSMAPTIRVLDNDKQIAERTLREIERCWELRACVLRDVNALAAVVDAQSSASPDMLAGAVNQLLASTKNLANQIGQIGVETRAVRPEECEMAWPTLPSLAAATPQAVEMNVEVPSHRELGEAPGAKAEITQNAPPTGPYFDGRSFRRSSFRGCATATVYSKQPGPSRPPVQCEVLTRDLSCGGIGIAGGERLFPNQVIVLDVLGRLLVGEVRWCRQVDKGFFVSGCKLVKAV